MYVGGALTLLDILGGRNIVVKKFYASLERDDLEYLIIHS